MVTPQSSTSAALNSPTSTITPPIHSAENPKNGTAIQMEWLLDNAMDLVAEKYSQADRS